MEQLPSHKKYQLSYKINLDNRTSLATVKLKQETQGTEKCKVHKSEFKRIHSKRATHKIRKMRS